MKKHIKLIIRPRDLQSYSTREITECMKNPTPLKPRTPASFSQFLLTILASEQQSAKSRSNQARKKL